MSCEDSEWDNLTFLQLNQLTEELKNTVQELVAGVREAKDLDLAMVLMDVSVGHMEGRPNSNPSPCCRTLGSCRTWR